MARPLFTGNYGSSLGNYSTAGQLLAARGQALGQAFQGIGQDVMNALEKHQQKKEKKAKEENAANMLANWAKQNKDAAQDLGLPVNDPEAMGVAITEAAKHPDQLQNFFSLATQAQRNKRAQQAGERAQELHASAKTIQEQNARMQQIKGDMFGLFQNLDYQLKSGDLDKQKMANNLERAKRSVFGGDEGMARFAKLLEDAKLAQLKAQIESVEGTERRAKAMQPGKLAQQEATIKATEAQTESVKQSTTAKVYQNQVNRAKGLISVDTNGNVHVKQGASGLPPEVIDEAIFQKESQYWEGEMNKLKRLDLIQTTAGKKKQGEYTDWLMSPDRVGKTSSTEFERLIKDLPLSEQERLKKLRLKQIAPEGGSPTSLLRTLDHFGSVNVEGSFNQKFVADMYRKAGTEVGNYPYISEENGEKRLYFKYATDVGKVRKGDIKLTELVEEDTKHYLKLQDQLQTGGSASPTSVTRPTQFDPDSAKSRMMNFIRQ